jgi:hypothetical protein
MDNTAMMLNTKTKPTNALTTLNVKTKAIINLIEKSIIDRNE